MKKEYFEPDMLVVDLEINQAILTGSVDDTLNISTDPGDTITDPEDIH